MLSKKQKIYIAVIVLSVCVILALVGCYLCGIDLFSMVNIGRIVVIVLVALIVIMTILCFKDKGGKF